MRRTVLGLAVCFALALVTFLVWLPDDAPAPRVTATPAVREYPAPRALPPPPLPARAVADGQPQLVPPSAPTAAAAAVRRPPLLDRLGAAGTKPESEPQVVHDVLEAFRRALGGFPAGEGNRQILNALRGANAQKLPFVPADHARLSASGELLDAWGTPFFFHAISRDLMEVRSAGADRELYTADDVVAGSPPPRPARPAIPPRPPAK